VIAVDTNLLVYAHRADSEWHEQARACIRDLAENRANWAIPWPCIHEFIAIVTHPRIYSPPSSTEQALNQVEAWLESPSLQLLHEARDHWSSLRRLLTTGHTKGPMVHDARIAALCLTHGVREFLTADRDFSRFPALRARNPLIA
jgi:uncharacterized protein